MLKPTTARYIVASEVRPPLTEALLAGEGLHAALVNLSDGAEVFRGCDERRQPLGGHNHAFVSAESWDDEGYITHFVVHARMGFDSRACQALQNLKKLWRSRQHYLQLVLIGIGQPEDFAGFNTKAGRSPLLAASNTWVSHTPFVPTRFPKRRKNGEPKLDADGLVIDGPEHELRRLLGQHRDPPSSVQRVEHTLVGPTITWASFHTQRQQGGGSRGPGRGFGFRLQFETPQSGPLAVGYGAHFGLGQFLPLPPQVR